MGFCATRIETDRDRKIRAYQQAVAVIDSLRKQGKLDDTCKVKAIPVPLYKNMVALVWGNSEIDYVAVEKQIRKISFNKVIKR